MGKKTKVVVDHSRRKAQKKREKAMVASVTRQTALQQQAAQQMMLQNQQLIAQQQAQTQLMQQAQAQQAMARPAAPAAGWYPDPTVRPYTQRYFDGSAWTEHVIDHTGAQTRDPEALNTI